MSKVGTIDLTQPFVKSLIAKLDKAETQRDSLLSAGKEALHLLEVAMFGGSSQANKLRAAIAVADTAEGSHK